MNRSRETALRRKVSREGRNSFGVVTWVVGKLDRDGLGSSLRHGVVQMLNGALSFDPLIEPHEADAFGKPCILIIVIVMKAK